MLNIFRYDLVRTRMGLSTYVILLFALVFPVLAMVGRDFTRDTAEEALNYIYMDEQVPNEVKDSVMGEREKALKYVTEKFGSEEKFKEFYTKEHKSFEKAMELMNSGGLVTLFAGIFTAILACREYATGYIKNLITRKHFRFNVIFSKMFTSFVFTLILVVLINALLYGYSAVIGGSLAVDLTKFLKFNAAIIEGSMAINMAVILVATLTQRSTPTMIFAFVYSQGILTSLSTLVDNFKILPFKIADISVVNKLRTFFYELPTSDFDKLSGEIFFIGSITIIVYLILSLVLMNRKDIQTGE